MGFWDFWWGAPNSDQQATATTVPVPQQPRLLDDTSSYPPPTVRKPIADPTPFQAPPKNRNALLFGAGVTFFAFSVLISRRSLARRRLAMTAANFTPSSHQVQPPKVPQVSPAFEAFEALNIATVNVLSVAMMGIGGTLWYLDINSIEDGRRFVRGGLGIDGTGKSEADAEEEFEEWMATVLSRKEAKEKSKEVEDTSRKS